eukprot:CAMPEP_0115842160 /NCGR_PEP_ID=MMETSP0287-20121206/7657_1 /TAXON_ID=412157 /ORGANISM="Chrysochromulina rotalis, Strain UIO044" /LENGTH=168 /DNA_ID=CAMNT_0003295821 /DNA_START=534 /DNA_END=1035 /DNA_ORIENTATION=+
MCPSVEDLEIRGWESYSGGIISPVDTEVRLGCESDRNGATGDELRISEGGAVLRDCLVGELQGKDRGARQTGHKTSTCRFLHSVPHSARHAQWYVCPQLGVISACSGRQHSMQMAQSSSDWLAGSSGFASTTFLFLRKGCAKMAALCIWNRMPMTTYSARRLSSSAGA